MDLSERFVYGRNDKKGIYCYNETPCPTKDVYESIGELGISQLQHMMREMIEVRKKMFGYGRPEFYGFGDREVFFDLESATGIELYANAKQTIEGRTGYEFQFPELIDEEGSFLLTRTFPFGQNLGKRAFLNRVEEWQGGVFLLRNLKDDIDEAEKAVRWLKERNPKRLLKILSEK